MKIEDAAVNLTSSHIFRKKHDRDESLRFWTVNKRPDFAQDNVVAGQTTYGVQVKISDGTKLQMAKDVSVQPVLYEPVADDTGPEEGSQLRAMRLVLEALIGQKNTHYTV